MRGLLSFAQGKSNRTDWGQPQGHRESKGLFTRCALHPKQDLFRGREPVPRLKFHLKAGVCRGGALYRPWPQLCTRSCSAVRPSSSSPPAGGARSSGHSPAQGHAILARGIADRSKPELRALFTQTRSSSSFCRARSCYIPTLLRHGRIMSPLQAFPS